MQSIQNLGLGVISIVAGKIVDTKGYLVLEVFFGAWLSGILISLVHVHNRHKLIVKTLIKFFT